MTLSKDQIKTSFWQHRPEANFPPPAVNYPEDYIQGSKLNLICTQLDLSSYQQKKYLDKWCQLLPELTTLRYLWFSSRTNQAMFEAACEVS